MLGKSISPTLDDFKITFEDDSAVESVHPDLKRAPVVFKNEVFNFNVFFKPLTEG